MNKAFVDTTILVNVLLKKDDLHDKAKQALSSFKESLLPVYAIKEFKAGALYYFCWLHNKLVLTNSYEKTVKAIQAVSRSLQKNLTRTALDALSDCAFSIGKKCTPALEKKYGPDAKLDKIQCDEAKYFLTRKIYNAWRKRREITTEVTDELPCYKEEKPYKKKEPKVIEYRPIKCDLSQSVCKFELELKKRKSDLKTLKSAIENLSPKRLEDSNRLNAIKKLLKGKKSLTDTDCRHLGDAVFSLLAPKDSIILTTNIKDHRLLASSLGKKAQKV